MFNQELNNGSFFVSTFAFETISKTRLLCGQDLWAHIVRSQWPSAPGGPEMLRTWLRGGDPSGTPAERAESCGLAVFSVC